MQADQMTSALQALYMEIADGSNLILDPVLDTYSLMEMLVLHLPAVIGNFSKLIALENPHSLTHDTQGIAAIVAKQPYLGFGRVARALFPVPAPVPAWALEIWKLVGGKYSLPSSQRVAASSARAGAA